MRFFDTHDTPLAAVAAAISPPGGAVDPAAEQSVREMVAAVREGGDDAVVAYAREWDWPDADTASLRVEADDIRAARQALAPEDAEALSAAIARVRDFHQRHLPEDHLDPREYGAIIGWRCTPVASAGIYVPAGVAPLPSSLIMAAAPAQVAGVARIAVATPPGRDGAVNLGILAAAALLGIEEIYRVGGPWAIAALAYGTRTIAPVDKIVGPGNAYVNLAKAMVAGAVGIDGFYGPSEVVILADQQADARRIAADLAAQAEHFVDSLAVLVTPSSALVEQVRSHLERSVGELERADIIRRCLDERGACVLVRDLEEGIELVNHLAPEHLQLMVADTRRALAGVRNAGCILVGPETPTAVSDYLAGPSHILPTGRSARFSSGLAVQDFLKRSSVVAVTREWLEHYGPQVQRLARLEGLGAHARSVAIRIGPDEA